MERRRRASILATHTTELCQAHSRPAVDLNCSLDDAKSLGRSGQLRSWRCPGTCLPNSERVGRAIDSRPGHPAGEKIASVHVTCPVSRVGAQCSNEKRQTASRAGRARAVPNVPSAVRSGPDRRQGGISAGTRRLLRPMALRALSKPRRSSSRPSNATVRNADGPPSLPYDPAPRRGRRREYRGRAQRELRQMAQTPGRWLG